MDNTRIFKTPFASVYPCYIQKAEKKGHTKAEVDTIIYWLTGYDAQTLHRQIEGRFTFEASISTDKETLVDYLEVWWDFVGDGSWDTDNDQTKMIICPYSKAGSYSVKLEVKDAGKLVNTKTKTLTNTYPTFTDPRDGNIYPYKKIGDKFWMIKNLAWLPAVSRRTIWSDTEKVFYVVGNQGTDAAAAKSNANYVTYGVLYNRVAARDVCPAGWHT